MLLNGQPANDGRYTNDKVVFAGVFHNKAGNKGYTPEDINGHGTHVAGTVACNFRTGPATVNGALIPYNPSGVAPAAKLGNFNVFPADVADARSEDIMNALEAALEQGFDVANMSLGVGRTASTTSSRMRSTTPTRRTWSSRSRPAAPAPASARSSRPVRRPAR